MKRDHLKEALVVLLQTAKGRQFLSMQEIVLILHGKGRFILLILLSFPFCLPIQIPGFSTPFGIVIVFIGFRIAFSQRIWLPRALLQKKMSARTVEKMAQKVLKFVGKLRVLISARLIWIFGYRGEKILNGLLISLLGALLALPLPIPLTNLSVGLPILLISIGLLERDGLALLIGYILSLVGLLFFLFLGFWWVLI